MREKAVDSKLYVDDFCAAVAEALGGKIKASSVRTQLYQLGFLKNQVRGRDIENSHVRPYYQLDQIDDAVRLLRGGK